MILRLLLIVSGAFASIAPADTIEQIVVTQLLTTREPSQLAWGAYLAANYRQTSAVPALIPLLRSTDRRLQIVVMDALIRLHADVPENDLEESLTNETLDATIVLVASDVKKYGDFLMRLLDRDLDPTDWVAVNAILATAPPPGFTARLWRELHLKFEFQVWDIGMSISDGYCITGGDRPVKQTADFPPIFHYVIHSYVSSGETHIATSPHPVSYVRSESAKRSGMCIPRDAYRLDFLKAMAGIGAENDEAQMPNVGRGLRWVSPARYLADAAALLVRIQNYVSFLRKTLIDHGLLTPQEAVTGPNLEVILTDVRMNHHDALPPIDWHMDR